LPKGNKTSPVEIMRPVTNSSESPGRKKPISNPVSMKTIAHTVKESAGGALGKFLQANLSRGALGEVQ
jgi:hypothetical protein